MSRSEANHLPDEFEEMAFWLAFDWRRDEKRYKRNPKADRRKE
nr:hypothetical protein [Escherichia coli]